VILETEWVHRYAYDFSRTDIHRALLHLCGLPQVNLAHPQQIAKALTWHQDGLDFADTLPLAGSNTQDLLPPLTRHSSRNQPNSAQ